MVSFWPFGRRDDNSPDSFERILSKLTIQITEQTTHLNNLRQRLRRYKALWTLSTILSWTLYVMVLFLLVGWKNRGPKEIVPLVGGPFVIYGGRNLIALFYDRRISAAETKLADLHAQRHDSLEKLKAATKFYSTQQILEKYGGGGEAMSRQNSNVLPNHFPDPNQQLRSRQSSVSVPQSGQDPRLRPSPEPPEVVMQTPPGPPGPPAEPLSLEQLKIQEQMRQTQIARPPGPPGTPIPPSAPMSRTPSINVPPPGPLPFSPMLMPPPSPGSRPNFVLPEDQTPSGGKWYDRLLDVLIGEDEMSSKNRLALICKSCRMVNGLAPPGTKSLEEVGKWGCANCGAWNGKALPDQLETEIVDEMWVGRRGMGRSSARGSMRIGGSMRSRKPLVMVESEDEGEEEEVNKEKQDEGGEEDEEVEAKPGKKKGGKGKR